MLVALQQHLTAVVAVLAMVVEVQAVGSTKTGVVSAVVVWVWVGLRRAQCMW